MPYKKTSDLPDSVKDHLPSHAQKIFMEAFNNAYETYKEPEKREGKESREKASMRVAWAAVKHEYKKNTKTGDWEPKKKNK